MFGFIKKLFGTAPKAETTEAPYKVEAPVVDLADIAIAQLPAGGAAVVEAPKAEAPKAEAKKEPAKKPRKPRAPKASGAKAPKKTKK